jgi:hypothetical protein
MFPDWLESFSRSLPTTSLLVVLQGISMLDFTFPMVVLPTAINLLIAIAIIIVTGFVASREDISLAD